MIKAVLFDIDNTLLSFDGYVKQSMEEGFAHFGLKGYEPWMFDVFTRENNALWLALERGEITFEDIKAGRWNRIFSVLGIGFDGPTFETYFRAKLNESAIPVEGSLAMLRQLRGKVILCAASNGPYEQQMNRLKLAGMAEHFDYFFISEEMGASKPSAEFFSLCFDRINEGRPETIFPEEMLIVGDSLTSDMAGGINAGMKTCFFDPQGKGVPDGMKLDHVVRSLSEVETYVLSRY